MISRNCRDTGPVSGSKRCHPQPSKHRMHLQEESRGLPKDTAGTLQLEGPPHSPGNSTGHRAREGALGGWFLRGKDLNVTLRPPRLLHKVVLPRLLPGRELDRGRGKGKPPLLKYQGLNRNSEMVIFPQWVHDSSTNTTSACLMPRHVRQHSWTSASAR